MNKKILVFLLIVGLVFGGYYYWYREIPSILLSHSFLTQEKITVQGEEYKLMTAETRKKLGLEQRIIPDRYNAAVSYVKASNAYKKLPDDLVNVEVNVNRNGWVNDPKFSAWYDENKESLRLVHEGAKIKDCQFPYLDEGGTIANMPLPQLQAMRSLARLLANEGRRHEFDKNYSEVIDSYLSIGKLGGHIAGSESTLIGQLVVVAVYAIMDGPVQKAIANDDLSEKDLKKIIKGYEGFLNHLPNFKSCLKSERRMSDEVLANPKLLGYDEASIKRQEVQLKKAQEQAWNRVEEWLNVPASEAFKPEKDFGRYLDSLTGDYKILRKALEPFYAAQKQFTKIETRIRGTTVFAAIKLYEKEKGQSPKSLSDLVNGDCLSELPKDPFSGFDFVYKVGPTGWMFYSVWDNLVDDGGAGRMPQNTQTEGGDKDLVYWSAKIPYQNPPPQ